jgi:hypothetical protein
VIIWVNGTFGAGKTTTGRALVQRDPRLRLFDPEWVGFMLMNNLADQDFTDFQQLESWRKLTPLVVDELVRVTGQDLVAAQTVLDEHYWHELQSGLAALGHEVVHVVVEADEVVMRQRIAADQNEPRRQAMAPRPPAELRSCPCLADGERRSRPRHDRAHS